MSAAAPEPEVVVVLPPSVVRRTVDELPSPYRRRLTLDEMLAEAVRRFGNDPSLWAFQCPRCEDVATAADFERVEVNPERLGTECIGIYLGTHADRGCDWVSYHVFPGPWLVTLPDGQEVPCFALAPPASPADGE